MPRRVETYGAVVLGPAAGWDGGRAAGPRVTIRGHSGTACPQTESYSCGVYCVNAALFLK